MKTNGWRKVCESALTENLENNFCSIIKSFANHAKKENYRADVPNSCCKFEEGLHFIISFYKILFDLKINVNNLSLK